MNKVLTIALGSLFAAGVMFSQIANAASDCEAKDAFMKKCESGK